MTELEPFGKKKLMFKVNKMSIIIALVLFIGCSTNTGKSNSIKEKEVNLNKIAEQQVPIQADIFKLLKGKILIQMPDGFDIMSEEMLAAKYPANQRPTLVYTNKDGSINFAFNHTANQITEDKLPEVLPVFVQQFNSIYPQIQWFKKDIEKINGKSFIIMEFITPAVDTRIYNLMYITELEGKMLMCSFNCMESQKKEWEAVAKESLNSVEMK